MSGDDGDMEKYKWCCDEIIPSSIKILTEFNLGEAQETRKCKSTHENKCDAVFIIKHFVWLF